MRFLGRPQPAPPVAHLQPFSHFSHSSHTHNICCSFITVANNGSGKNDKNNNSRATVEEELGSNKEHRASSCELRAPTLWHGNVPGGFL